MKSTPCLEPPSVCSLRLPIQTTLGETYFGEAGSWESGAADALRRVEFMRIHAVQEIPLPL